MSGPFTWARTAARGYEVSTAGDTRFSALHARLPAGGTIEQAYQRAKGSGKGRPSPNPAFDYWGTYLGLWRVWAAVNGDLIQDLHERTVACGYVLTDTFATTENNQARALATLLNERAAALANAGVMVVWLIHLRETLSSDLHVHTASTRERAEAWMRKQTAADWDGSCFTLWPSPVDRDDIPEGGPIEFYSLTGERLAEQPVDLLQAREAMLERHGHRDIPAG